MPIGIDSDAWVEGETGPTLEFRIIDFLKDHPNEAFRVREIAEEALGLPWTEAEEHSRANDELSDEEYYERYPRDEDHPTALSLFRDTDSLRIVIGRLDRAGLVECREVGVEAFEDAYMPHREKVFAYTYAGGSSN